jgi:hypothetical protein
LALLQADSYHWQYHKQMNQSTKKYVVVLQRKPLGMPWPAELKHAITK